MCHLNISFFVALKQQLNFSAFSFQKSLSKVWKIRPPCKVFFFEIFEYLFRIELFVFNWQIFLWHSLPLYLWALAKSLYLCIWVAYFLSRDKNKQKNNKKLKINCTMYNLCSKLVQHWIAIESKARYVLVSKEVL